jgi:hypothetical protein
MTTPSLIRLTLKSASTFGRGDGVAGLVDREIEHDTHGFPFLRGKTLKGLLKESAENVVYALENLQGKTGWSTARDHLFGKPGRGTTQRGILHVGDAVLPLDLRNEILSANLSREDVLYSLTAIRRQTSMNPNGGPEKGSLRSMRVLLPNVILESPLTFEQEVSDTETQLLAAAILDFRRAGTGRNRGRGSLVAELDSAENTRQVFEQFAKAISQ